MIIHVLKMIILVNEIVDSHLPHLPPSNIYTKVSYSYLSQFFLFKQMET